MKRFLLSVAAFFVAAAAFAQDFQQLPNDPAVRVGKLDNGMTYYIRHNDKPAQRAEFYLATNVGAIQETPDQDGLAHFLEHMCFNGTKNFPGKTLLEYLQSIGASFGGNINAATGVEETTYMLNNIPVTREGIIDTCLLVMHDYSHFVTCDPVEIDKERGVIIEERRARRNAAWRLHEQSLPYYYGDSKYAGCTLIGSQENLETFKPESLTNFYHTWHRPDLQALIVVGDIDVDSIEAKIKSTFADIPAAVDPKPKDVIKIPENEKPLIGVLTDPECSGSSIEVLWRSEADDEAYNSTDVGFLTSITKTMIAMIMAERFDAITSKPGAPFLGADLGAGDLCETCQATMGDVSFKDGDWEPAFRSFLTEVERMRRYGFSSAELQRAKDNILSAFEKAVEAADSRKNADFVRPLINNFFDNDAYMTPQVRYEVAKALLGQVPDMIFALAANALVDGKSISIVYKAPAKEGLVHPTPEQLQTVYDEVSASEIDAPVEEEVASEFVNPASLKGSKVKKTSTGLYGSTVWTLKNGVKVVVLPTEYKKDQILFTWYKNGGETLISDEDLVSFEENVYGLFQRNSGISKFSSNEASKMLAGKHLSVSSYISNIRTGSLGTFLNSLRHSLCVTCRRPVNNSYLAHLKNLLFLNFILYAHLRCTEMLHTNNLQNRIPRTDLRRSKLPALIVAVKNPASLLHIIINLPVTTHLAATASELPEALHIFNGITQEKADLMRKLRLMKKSLLQTGDHLIQRTIYIITILEQKFPGFILFQIFLQHIRPVHQKKIMLPASTDDLHTDTFPFKTLLII